MSRSSSGSCWRESAVEPTRSQNITVSWRRSASGKAVQLRERLRAEVGRLAVQPPEEARENATDVALASPAHTNILPSWSTARWWTSINSSLRAQGPPHPAELKLERTVDTRPRRWSMAVAWSRISSKFIANPPCVPRPAGDRWGMSSVIKMYVCRSRLAKESGQCGESRRSRVCAKAHNSARQA